MQYANSFSCLTAYPGAYGVTASYISTIVEDTPDPQTGAKRYKYQQATDWIRPEGY